MGKLLLGLALCALLLVRVDLRALGSSVSTARALPLGASWLCSFAALVLLEARRLQIAFGAWGLGYRFALRLTLEGMFVGTFTPGAVGSEGYKLLVLRPSSGGLARPLIQLILLRSIGALAQGLAALAALLAAPERLGSVVRRLAWQGPRVALAPALLGLAAALAAFLAWGRLAPRFSSFGRQALESLRELPARRAWALGGWSLAIVALRALALWLLVQSLGAALPYSDLVVVGALVLVASTLPISPAGLGVQEGVLAGSLVLLGTPAPAAIAVALLLRAAQLAFALIGGGALVSRRGTAGAPRQGP